MLTLMILAGFTTSCEKEEVAEENVARVIVTPIGDERGGDDEEEPIVHGVVEDGNGNGVANADVKIYEVGSSTPTDGEITDSNGEFTMQVPAGDYYFKVTHSGNTTTTNNISITQNVNVTIVI